jgi:hypothetical protein
MKQMGYLSDPPKPGQIFEPTFIEKVHPDPHHYHAGGFPPA